MAGHEMTVTHPSDRELRIERRFDAPRQLVWDAHTRPELIRQWLNGPEGWEMPECTFEARAGGAYRFTLQRITSDGTPGETMAWGGTIIEYQPIDRMVATERFDDAWYPGECVNTSTFEELEGRAATRLTVVSRFESPEALQTAMATGMVDGMADTYDQLEVFLIRVVTKEDAS